MKRLIAQNDDLWLLAHRHYGDHRLWRVIYRANQPLIGDDPDNVQAGMLLDIPEIETEGYTVTIAADVAEEIEERIV